MGPLIKKAGQQIRDLEWEHCKKINELLLCIWHDYQATADWNNFG